MRSAGILVLSLFACPLLAAPPSVESISPSAGQRGREFTLTFTGARLSEPQEILADSPGIVCSKLVAKSDTEVLATFTASPEAALGEHAFRLRTKGGASELRTFHLSPFPIVVEQEPNDKQESAPLLRMNTTISGTLQSADIDCYAVQMKKGERLTAEMVGVRLGAEFVDGAIRVFGPDGREIASVDDTPLFRQDPFVSFLAPVDGRYVVQVQDSTFGGSPSHRYLLHLGHFPRPASVFPVGGQAGTTLSVRTNDGSALQLKLPANGEKFAWYPSEQGQTAPTAQPFRVSNFPQVNESEPNDSLQQLNPPADWPIAFNGIIQKPGDTDHFRFKAKKGQTINVEAFAYRVGTPTDTVVAVLDSSGELLGMNDDDETHDSRVVVNIPADGEYVIRVTDKRGQGGPNFVYRVELDKPAVGLNVFLPQAVRKTQERTVIAVPRGNRVTAFLAVRRDGLNEPVSLSAGELPSGVSVKLGTIPTNEYLLPVVFEAAADAPLGGKLVALTGKAESVQGQFSQEIGLVRGPGDSLIHKVTLNKLAVVVIDDSPVSVSIVPPTLPLVPDSTLDVRVKIVRQAGFSDAVDLTFPSLPPGVEVPTAITVLPEQSEVTVTLVASPDADLGDWKLVGEIAAAKRSRGDRDPLVVGMNGLGTPGAAGGTGRRRRPSNVAELTPVATPVVPIATQKPRLNGTLASVAVEQGQNVKVVCRLETPLSSTSPFTAKLDGLPPRAKAEDVKVLDREIHFLVKVDPTTPVGEVKSLLCELRGSIDGQAVVYRVGRGSSFRVAAPGTLKSDATGKTLSPLEALRQQQKK